MDLVQNLKLISQTSSWFGASKGIPDKVFYAEQLAGHNSVMKI